MSFGAPGNYSYVEGEKVEVFDVHGEEPARQATVTYAAGRLLHVRYTTDTGAEHDDPAGEHVDVFLRDSGWRFGDGQMNWRLRPRRAAGEGS